MGFCRLCAHCGLSESFEGFDYFFPACPYVEEGFAKMRCINRDALVSGLAT